MRQRGSTAGHVTAPVAVAVAVAVVGLLLAALAVVARPALPRQATIVASASPSEVPRGSTVPASSTAPVPTFSVPAVTYGPPCAGAAAGTGWRRLDIPAPPARALHVAVFDARRGEALVYGGVGADGGVLDDLWAFSLQSEQWQKIAVEGDRPAPRWAAAALHDAVRDRMVLFFGNAAPASDEVWALNLGTRRWSLLGAGPLARYDAAAATDGGERAWIYGGFAGPQFRPDTALADLWQLDIATDSWRPLPPGGESPPPTTNAALAFHDGALYLLGGHDAGGVTPGFWRYDLARQEWQSLAADARPAAWTHHARAVDAACADLLLFGGDDADAVEVPNLEALRLGARPTLARLNAAPAGVARHHAAMALDPVTRQLVLFGGWRGQLGFLDDTWIYRLGSDG